MASNSQPKTVFVGLSGGVDSSVSAALLKEQGYRVVGVFIKSWYPIGFPCPYQSDRRDAMRVCAKLSIPFLEFNFEKIYKKEVTDYLIKEYKAGRTPNPDVMCNKFVKFGAFFKKALQMGARYVATGHYARIKQTINNKRPIIKNSKKLSVISYQLLAGIDQSKDQSYFLWTLTQDQLKNILFPVGYLKKEKVRKLALKYGLPTAHKPDSQGICFLGQISVKDFLKKYIKEKRGLVLNQKKEIIGYHSGVWFYTLGERHGFTITQKTALDKPYYIIEKNVKKNILIVAHFISGHTLIKIRNTNWLSQPQINKNYLARFRHLGEFKKVKVVKLGKTIEILFEQPVLVASGQSLVLYDKDICLGGGVVI